MASCSIRRRCSRTCGELWPRRNKQPLRRKRIKRKIAACAGIDVYRRARVELALECWKGGGMEQRRRNWHIWVGFLLSILGVLSYFLVFARYPVTRDTPWANFVILAAGIGFVIS